MSEKITFSVIKADVGGYVGHSCIHPALMEEAEETLEDAKRRRLLVDFHVTRVGDDLELIMTHRKGEDNPEIHELGWNALSAATDVAKSMKLYGAGQDLLSDAFSGNVKGMGPGVAEMEFEERPSEPILIFMADKTSAGAWNMPLVKMFADPFTTIGLVISPTMHEGFRFEVHDVLESRRIYFDCPDELYDMLVFVGAPARYMIRAVYHRRTAEIGAVSSTQRLSLIAGRYVGKDDPVLVVRSQGAFPAVGEILEPFSFPHMVEGWMRGSHHGPLMPVSVPQSNPSRFDGPPRVVCLGFQLCNGGLVGPRDMFDDPSFDEARRQANLAGEYLRRHGPFEPHRLPLEEMEYTTMPEVAKKLEGRFEALED
ncbi:MAG: fructose 1,6-bisphosphatase [Anaerolineae bacterium]|nr:fructose 1,6-bisphosphatase [Anaerolineae bacterium]NIN93555.1 fructose 1,6-bisphosphatase [Anaerolineae bacterium]NIQ76638.1 fructose 1,6-bisphosphatase [Anaerolineae bacterium]